jgi:alkylresorcinol/alkylpyrone synthase
MSQPEATYLTQQVCCQSDDQARIVGALFRRAGVQNRHTVLPHQVLLGWNDATGDAGVSQRIGTRGLTTQERMQIYANHAPLLASRAADEALQRSELTAREITHLITVSCTGFIAPGVDVDIIRQLGLAPTVERTHVGFMGCHGAINGLRVARALAVADERSRLLLCAVELCSIHFCTYWAPERLVGNAVFADGAAAIVGGAPQSENDWQVTAFGSCLLPDSTDAMTWAIGDHGFDVSLSPKVPDLIRAHLRDWFVGWLAQHRLSLADIKSWAIHPGGPRILNAAEESLGLPREATAVSREVLAQFGNMSSPTVLFIVDRLRRYEAQRPCVALGFGPGLVAEAALFL